MRREGLSEATWREVREALDEEVARLPRCQRKAFVLCALEGRTASEAAREIGWWHPADALRKFNQYRGVVDELLRCPKEATIDPTLRRDGDDVRVTAAAELLGGAPGAARLRLVLVEREMRYAG